MSLRRQRRRTCWGRIFVYPVTFQFLLTTIFWSIPNPAFALSIQINLPKYQEITLPSRTSVVLPSSLGTITESSIYQPDSSSHGSLPVIFHIQDAHNNLDAQKSIERILQYLAQHHSLEMIFLEGGTQKWDPDLYRFFEDSPLNQKVVDSMLQEGIIGGGETFLTRADAPAIPAYGVENPEQYRNNLRAFTQLAKIKPEIQRQLDILQQWLVTHTSKLSSPELRECLKLYTSFRNNLSQLDGILESLKLKARKWFALDLSDVGEQTDWPQIIRYFQIQKMLKNKNEEIFEKEKETLILNRHTGHGLESVDNLFNVGPVPGCEFTRKVSGAVFG